MNQPERRANPLEVLKALIREDESLVNKIEEIAMEQFIKQSLPSWHRFLARVVMPKWHHVAGTYDQNFIRAYVDGRMEGEAAFKDVPDTNEEPLVIGAITPKVNFFTGVIDEVGLFNIGLTEDDLKMIKEVGLSRALAVSLSEKLATTWSAIKTEH